MTMIVEHNAVRLAPLSLNVAGTQPSPLLETCLAALRLASASDMGFMDALDLSVHTFKPPYVFLRTPADLPDPDPDDWSTPVPGVDTHGMDSAANLARLLARDMDVDHACAEAMAVSRALRVAHRHPKEWRCALAQTRDMDVDGLDPDPTLGWCSTLARHGRTSGPLACAVASAIRDGHWGARRVANVSGDVIDIPSKIWMGLETENEPIMPPLDDAPDGEPDF